MLQTTNRKEYTVPHTAESLALDAIQASSADPTLPLSPAAQRGMHHRMHAIKFAATSALEEFEDVSSADLRLILESIVVLAS